MNAGVDNIQTERLTWIDEFEDGGEVFDFFASTSGLWWYHRLPPDIRNKETEKTRTYFQRKNVKVIIGEGFVKGSFNVKYQHKTEPKVSIIIPLSKHENKGKNLLKDLSED